MNINGFTNNPAALRQLPPFSREGDKTSVAPVSETVIENVQEAAAGTASAQRDDRPWLSDPGFELVSTHDEYVSLKKLHMTYELAWAEYDYDRFLSRLSDTHPEIAAKKFGFTLAPDKSLRIIDYDGALTDSETVFLTTAINDDHILRRGIQQLSKSLITLVGLDHHTFGGRYRLDIDNFHSVIDFAKIFSVIDELKHDTWIRQVLDGAERRQSGYVSLEV
jgi:hypothetical protein